MKPPRQDSQPHLVALHGDWEDFSLLVSSQHVYKFGKDGSEANADETLVPIAVQ
jgi:hypothetical protein